MITILIAYGPNSIAIPCRIFENVEAGREYCDPLFAKIGEEPAVEFDGNIRYNADLDSIDENDEVSAELFTDHYYGCGGPYRFVLQEVPFNEKFVPFDLD